jgi:hypothetical protein
MTSTAVQVPNQNAVRSPEWLGQATAVEQARAVAEVQAAVIVAQQVPRIVSTAVASMRESCAQQGLADKAFFSYRRGGSDVSGRTIHLARELARCWGNVDYGVKELRRDDDAGISEMQAWAWDVQTNTRSSLGFVVPHKRDKTGGAVKLTDLRDVYENNANMGARRLREAIFSILPAWFTDEAADACRKALEGPVDKPIASQAAAIVAAFSTKHGVTREQLEARVGRPLAQWTAPDLADLRVVGGTLNRRESTVAEEFPQTRVTAAEVLGQTKAATDA